MSTPHQKSFVSLMEQFTGRQLDAAAFCTQFTTLWIEYRDAAYAQKPAWPEASKDAPFRDVVNAVHSACAVFAPVLEAQWQLDTEQLRSFVQTTLAAMQPLAPAAHAV